MSWNKPRIIDEVIAAIRETVSVLHDPSETLDDFDIVQDTNPISDLGLDSLDGVYVTCLLADQLSLEIPANINLFINDKRQCPNSVLEITFLLERMLREEGTSDE